MTAAPDPSVERLWRAFLRSRVDAAALATRGHAAFAFGDDPAMADELCALVLAGRKRATAPSLWELEAAGDAVPRAGDLGVVLDGVGRARCVVETVAVEIVPFAEVSTAFARREGEGDGSLDHWRRVHWAYYGRVLAPYDLAPRSDMPIVCEAFEVVFLEAPEGPL